MKNIFVIVRILFFSSLFAQDYDTSPSTNLESNVSGILKTGTYKECISKQVKGNIDVYTSQSGEVFSVGDTITLGVAFRNEAFDYVKQCAVIEVYPLPNDASGSNVRIKKIKFFQKKTWVYTTSPNGYVYQLQISNIDGALANGEILSKIKSSDEALAELKKWKTKLELEIISQDEYDAKKAELIEFIK